MVAATESVIDLYPYQREFFRDQARVLVAIWCRQAGKDFTTACKAVDDAIRNRQHWFIVSKTQRQADATFTKCKTVAEIFKRMFKVAGEIRAVDGDPYFEQDPELRERGIEHAFRCQARTLHLPGGGSVTALPGRDPDGLAGLTGNIIFTEFALMPKGGYDHWRVVFPLATRGYQVVIITTPRGRNTKAFELYSDPETYSVHEVDIYRAVAEGMPLTAKDGSKCTIDEFRKLYKDEVGWKREYELEWTGDLASLIKWAQLVAAGQWGAALPFDMLRIENSSGWQPGKLKRMIAEATAGGTRAEMGWDVARHGDLSALWINLSRPGHMRSLRCLTVMHETSFALQREIVREAMDASPLNVGAGDATGLGMDSNETLANLYGERWIAHTFTSKGKSEVGSALRTAFDDNDQAIPPVDGEHKAVAADIYAVQVESDEESGPTGNKTLKLIETENPLLPESHCDIAYAAGLARKAAAMRPLEGYLWVA